MKIRFVAPLIVVILTFFSATAQELALVKQDDKFSYINKTGEVVINAPFNNSKSFSDGLAAAEKEEKWGYINGAGEWAIEPQYDKVKYFDSGLALVLKDDQWRYINKAGATVEMPTLEKYNDFNEGVAIFKQSDFVGLIDPSGTVILEPTYSVIRKFRNGHAKVKKGEGWGMINTKGELVIPTEFLEIGNTFSPNGVYVKKGEVFGIYVDGTFNPVEGADKIWNFYKDAKLTYARKGKKVGFVNSKGEWVIEPQFDKVKAFSNGLAPVLKDKKWGYINEEGKVVIDYQFKDAEVFAENGMAPVREKRWGFIDKTGKLVIPMEYDISVKFGFIKKGKEEKGFIGNLARVKSKDGWGFLNEKGELLNNTWYQEAEPFVRVD